MKGAGPLAGARRDCLVRWAGRAQIAYVPEGSQRAGASAAFSQDRAQEEVRDGEGGIEVEGAPCLVFRLLAAVQGQQERGPQVMQLGVQRVAAQRSLRDLRREALQVMLDLQFSLADLEEILGTGLP